MREEYRRTKAIRKAEENAAQERKVVEWFSLCFTFLTSEWVEYCRFRHLHSSVVFEITNVIFVQGFLSLTLRALNLSFVFLTGQRSRCSCWCHSTWDHDRPGFGDHEVARYDWGLQSLLSCSSLQVNRDNFSFTVGWDFATLQRCVVPASGEVVKHNYRSSHLPDDVDAFKFSKFAHLYFQVWNALNWTSWTTLRFPGQFRRFSIGIARE
jgi:hypothetical protein